MFHSDLARLKTAFLNLALLSFAAAVLSGCAFTTARVPLRYTPHGKATLLAGAHNIIVTVSVKDLRKHKRIGNKVNGYGVSTAPIYSTTNIASLVQRAFEMELRDRGFRVAHTSPVLVDVAVTKLHNRFSSGFFSGSAVAVFHMNVMVKNRYGKEVFSQKVSAVGKNSGIIMTSGSNAAIAVDRAIENGVQGIFHNKQFITALLHAG